MAAALSTVVHEKGAKIPLVVHEQANTTLFCTRKQSLQIIGMRLALELILSLFNYHVYTCILYIERRNKLLLLQ